MKQILILCAILTASLTYSQSTIQISPEQAKEAIKTKQRVEKLESALHVQGLVIAEYKLQVADLKGLIGNLEQQNALIVKNYDLLKIQLEVEKSKKPKDKTFIWILRCLAAAAGGYLIGSL